MTSRAEACLVVIRRTRSIADRKHSSGALPAALPVSALVLVSFGGISAPIEASPQS